MRPITIQKCSRVTCVRGDVLGTCSHGNIRVPVFGRVPSGYTRFWPLLYFFSAILPAFLFFVKIARRKFQISFPKVQLFMNARPLSFLRTRKAAHLLRFAVPVQISAPNGLVLHLSQTLAFLRVLLRKRASSLTKCGCLTSVWLSPFLTHATTRSSTAMTTTKPAGANSVQKRQRGC